MHKSRCMFQRVQWEQNIFQGTGSHCDYQPKCPALQDSVMQVSSSPLLKQGRIVNLVAQCFH